MALLRNLSIGFARAIARGASLAALRLRSVLGLLDEAVTIATIAGLALLVLAQPAFEATKGDWRNRLALAATFLDRTGQEMGRRGILHEDRLALVDLSPHLIAAVLATEDRRFWQHGGIDPAGLVRALLANARADAVVQGGSTITQQLAKMLFLSGERTIARKITEGFLAVWLEWRLTKPEILKLYLDRAYLGGGTFGVEAAARFYFGTSARDLDLRQAAMLAGLLKAPSLYAPHLHPAAARTRAEEVLGRMLAAGAITWAEREAARTNPAIVVGRDGAWRPDHYLDWAFAEVQRLAAAGRFGPAHIVVVETALDPALQRDAEAAVETALSRDGTRLAVREGAVVVMEPGGAVRAMVGGRAYAGSQFNRATEAERQPGSAFKPFVYLAALAHAGLRPTSTVEDREVCISDWCPANYARTFSGTMSLAAALARSINTVAVWLSIEIGREAGEMTPARQARFGRARIIELARKLGIRTTLRDTPSLPLGSSEVTLLDLTAANATFAGGGMRADPHAVLAVRANDGQVLYRRDRDGPRAAQVLSPDLAGEMNVLLRKVVQDGTARAAAILGHPSAGKTGTTSAYRDAWYVGFTSHLVGGVWLGNDDSTPMRGVTGGTLPAAIWRDVMAPAHRGLQPRPLPEPTGDGPFAVARAAGGGFGAAAAASGGFAVVSGGRGWREIR